MSQQGSKVPPENHRGRSTNRDPHNDRQTSENRSRSPKAKPEKSPVIVLGSQDPPGDTPPNNPDAALSQGWKEEDLGGNGDCLFRAVGAHLEYAEGAQSVSTKQATTRGALLRKDCMSTTFEDTLIVLPNISTPRLMVRGPELFKLGLPLVVSKKPLLMEFFFKP